LSFLDVQFVLSISDSARLFLGIRDIYVYIQVVLSELILDTFLRSRNSNCH
jgi:hypothetical protein